MWDCGGWTSLAQSLMADGLSVEVQVTGSSMSPFIQPGDVVVVDPLDAKPIRIGDVLAFQRDPGRMAIHRVVASRRRQWILRGDGSRREDAPADPAAIVGRVRSARRGNSPVRWGLGPERRLIAYLSRAGVLPSLVEVARAVLRVTRGRRER
jgi:hypothetical protein